MAALGATQTGLRVSLKRTDGSVSRTGRGGLSREPSARPDLTLEKPTLLKQEEQGELDGLPGKGAPRPPNA